MSQILTSIYLHSCLFPIKFLHSKVDFRHNHEAARGEINHWASNATHQRIKELFPQGTIDQDTRLVLGNAVFFKVISATGVEWFPFSSLPISFCFRFELLMMLPKSNEEFPAFVEAITKPGELEKVLESPFYDQMAHVMIPRFKLSMLRSLNLKNTLKSMGVTHLFENADLRKISDDPLFVSDVVHQAVLEVNEAGAVATGATGVGIANRSLLRPIVFNANHAFVVAVIVDKKYPLFMGHVTVAEE
ncbi:unnamed protein product [Echinostoma caproni]|uniref:SERPIN domain-containing protein n=1 Tax=Echinostoma caproni TaxID=27848 RepID=A0A183AQX9_9TREM|nr:unnamed protein product [Echinostoma caproni]